MERDALLGAVRAVVDVVASRNTIPILGNLLIEAGEGRLTVTGTNLDLQATSTVEAAGSLATTVDAQKMVAAVASFRAGRMTLAPVDGKSSVVMKQGRGQRTLATLPPTDFPKRKALEGAVAFSMPAAALARVVECTQIAQSVDESRLYLNGIHLHAHDGRHLRGVATDGFKMVRVETALPGGAEAMPPIIVPSKAVAQIRKMLTKAEGEVAIEVTAAAMSLAVGSSRLLTKLVDGTFPDYERVIPAAGGKYRIECMPAAIVEPIVAVAAVVNAEGDSKMKVRKVQVAIGGADGHEVRSWDTSGTLANEPIDVEVSGGALDFGVNHSLFKPIVDLFAESGRMSIELGGNETALRITGEKDPDLIAVLQTMRL
ncbi:DNA polymerase III subunit beta [uncultured Sphingomonas sp.]|uniref:DNA polymerase III subunit beta n=1 Tax=uncultured Sphingomonas sp. TaxID=158754 RepID=UPI002626593F|nr:DNA polymerase III subunit beta [uncultured Sphingomonas sp.]